MTLIHPRNLPAAVLAAVAAYLMWLAQDERDRAIATRAGAHAYSVLAIAIVALIVQLGFGGAAFQALATPVSVAHWLIGLLILSTIAEHLSATLQYRRDQP